MHLVNTHFFNSEAKFEKGGKKRWKHASAQIFFICVPLYSTSNLERIYRMQRMATSLLLTAVHSCNGRKMIATRQMIAPNPTVTRMCHLINYEGSKEVTFSNISHKNTILFYFILF